MRCGAEHNCRQQIEGAPPGDACHVPEGDHTGEKIIQIGIWTETLPILHSCTPTL